MIRETQHGESVEDMIGMGDEHERYHRRLRKFPHFKLEFLQLREDYGGEVGGFPDTRIACYDAGTCV